MKLSDIPRDPPAKTLRQFAGAWLVFLLAWAAHQVWVKGHPVAAVVLAVLAVGVGGMGLVWPRAVRWVFVAAMLVAFPVGWVVSQAMLAVMYYGVMTPVALWFRMRGRDLLGRKRRPERTTYWMAKTTPTDARSYFRQY